MRDYVFPNDRDIERVVLACILDYREKFEEVRDIISENCFYDSFNKEIYKIFDKIQAEGETPDIFSILTEYKKMHGEEDPKLMDILSITDDSSFQVPVFKHTLYLRELHSKRKLYELGHYLVNNSVASTDLADISERIKDVTDNLFVKDENSRSTIMDAINGVYDIVNRNLSGSTELTGSPTGFTLYDKRSGGLQKSDLVIVGGESSHGKTSLALSIVLYSALYGEKIAVYSLEMKKEQLAARLMAMSSGISSGKLLYSPLASYQFEQLDKSISGLCNSTILFDDRSTSNLEMIINSIRTMKAKYDVDGVVIDYLQILSINQRELNTEEQLANASRRLKNLAKDLNIWIMALSQLNRDQNNPVPNMNRVRGSGQIFEAADVVMFVYQPIKYGKNFPEPFYEYETDGYALIDVAKGRNIGVMKFLAAFSEETTHFTDVELQDIPQKEYTQEGKKERAF